MAKNLKLKIKNTQLAQALNLDKVKKSATIKEVAEEELEAKKEVKQQEKPAAVSSKKPVEPVKRKGIKATDLPSSFLDQKSGAKKKEEEPVQEVQMESFEEKEEVKPSLIAKEEVVSEKEEKKQQEVTSPAAQVEAKKEEARVKPKEGNIPPAKEYEPPEDKEAKGKRFKEVKVVKKVEQKSFDARDRHGLRESNEDAWRRRRRPHKKGAQKPELIVRPKSLKIKVPITVKDFAVALKVKASELIQKLFMQGVLITINDYLEDPTTLQLLGVDFDCEITIDTSEEERLRITGKSIVEEITEANEDELVLRPPVVTFMGHVDHGKTSLIDALRKSNLAAGEAGAITQHIGAFRCHNQNGDITVLDTPGHEAFKEMRMRGATVTDLVILVVAGDEGIMPQTDEAIKHAKEANVPILVALNKCDKPTFNPDQVYRQLAERDLLPETWGGQTITVNCSAATKQGIQTLLEMIQLQAEVLELRANPHSRARGTVLESQLHRGMGAVATVLVQNGTLKIGDALVLDEIYGRVKTMQDEYGKIIHEAPPSTPVKITGLSGIPEAGCEFIAVENEKVARQITEERTEGVVRAKLKGRKTQVELEGMLERKRELSEKKVLNLILRADVQGSLEALKNSLLKIPSQKVELNFISEGVGQISESDVQLAATSGAKIIGFHTSIESHAENDIARLKVVIKSHDVIYHLIQDVEQLMLQILDKIRVENEVAKVLVKAIFKASQYGVIAGCQVLEGPIKRNHHVKLERDGKVIWEGELASLKRVKEDVKEVAKGMECGILLKNNSDIQADDIIKAYEITYHQQELT